MCCMDDDGQACALFVYPLCPVCPSILIVAPLLAKSATSSLDKKWFGRSLMLECLHDLQKCSVCVTFSTGIEWV